MGTTLHNSTIALVGGGGHATVVREAAELSGWLVAGYFDDELHPLAAQEIVRLGDFRDSLVSEIPSILAVGDLATRERVAAKYRGRLATVIHPAAIVSRQSDVGVGSFVGATAVVNTHASLGRHSIINTRAVIEHHCCLGTNCHIGPGAVLGGSVTVGENTLVGIAANVNPGVKIGSNCIVGAGAVVTRDVSDGQIVAGVPARPMKSRLRKSA